MDMFLMLTKLSTLDLSYKNFSLSTITGSNSSFPHIILKKRKQNVFAKSVEQLYSTPNTKMDIYGIFKHGIFVISITQEQFFLQAVIINLQLSLQGLKLYIQILNITRSLNTYKVSYNELVGEISPFGVEICLHVKETLLVIYPS